MAKSPPQYRWGVSGWVIPSLSRRGWWTSVHSQPCTDWKPIEMKLEDTGTILLCDKETRVDRDSTEIRGSWKLTEQFGSEKVDALFTRCTQPRWIARWGLSLSKYNKLASSAFSTFKVLAWTTLDKHRSMAEVYTGMTQGQDDAEISLNWWYWLSSLVQHDSASGDLTLSQNNIEPSGQGNARAGRQAYAEMQNIQEQLLNLLVKSSVLIPGVWEEWNPVRAIACTCLQKQKPSAGLWKQRVRHCPSLLKR